MPFTAEEIQLISEVAKPGVLVQAATEASEVGRRIAGAALDSYTKEDWLYVLNALRPDRAARYILSRPPEERPELLLLIEAPSRRAAVDRPGLFTAAN